MDGATAARVVEREGAPVVLGLGEDAYEVRSVTGRAIARLASTLASWNVDATRTWHRRASTSELRLIRCTRKSTEGLKGACGRGELGGSKGISSG